VTFEMKNGVAEVMRFMHCPCDIILERHILIARDLHGRFGDVCMLAFALSY